MTSHVFAVMLGMLSGSLFPFECLLWQSRCADVLLETVVQEKSVGMILMSDSGSDEGELVFKERRKMRKAHEVYGKDMDMTR